MTMISDLPNDLEAEILSRISTIQWSIHLSRSLVNLQV
ncbi:BnaA05g14510D [Brassica napus]|uniref:BnaA05g14510D protein n=1 Tax=Brassica napus TaxID=3708 RepID=A0A078GHB3_BRANA|nr:BnaA05g14510D [Brassica napus]